MTSPNSPEQKLIEALESIAQGTINGFATPAIHTISTDAIQIASSLLAELAELREKVEKLYSFASEILYSQEYILPNGWYKGTSKVYGEVLREIYKGIKNDQKD